METCKEKGTTLNKYTKENDIPKGEENQAFKIRGKNIVGRIPWKFSLKRSRNAPKNLAAGDGARDTILAVVCQQAHALSDVTFETTFHELGSLVSLYVSMTTEKLNTLERAMSVTVHEVGEIYHQSLCEGLSVMAGDNSDNDLLICEKGMMFVDEKARFSQHFIEKMMTECKHDVKETRTSLLGDILYEFYRGLCQTPKEFIRVSRKEIHDYLDDLEDAYISKCDKAAGEFYRKLLERILTDFKQERDIEKNNGTEYVQNIDVNNKYDQLTATGASTKKMVKNRWRGFKKFLCCCQKKKCTEKNQYENGKTIK